MTGEVELSVAFDNVIAVVSLGDTDIVVVFVVKRFVEVLKLSGTTRGLEVTPLVRALSVTGTTPGQDTEEVGYVVYVIFESGDAPFVETPGILDSGSSVVVILLVVCQSVVADEAAVVAGVMWVTFVGSSLEMVVVVKFPKGRSVGDVCWVVLLVLNGITAVTDCIFSSVDDVGMDIVFLSAGGETDMDVVDGLLSKPGRLAGDVAGGSFPVVDLVLVPVSTEASGPGAVAFCVTIDGSETGARAGVEDLPV